MSRATDNSNRANLNSPWLLLNTARRASNASIAIATNALNEIRDNVSRVLDYSSDSESSPPVHIITEREFPFYDYSLLATTETNGTASENTRHYRHINHRRNSLTRFDGSIFDPNEIYQAQLGEMAHSPVDPTAQSPRDEIDNEILRLRNTPGQNNPYFEEARPGRRVTFDTQPTENMLLHELLQEIRELRIQVGSNRNEREERNRVSRNLHDNALDLTYGRTHSDIRNQPGTSLSFLSLKEARNMIPEIDGTSRNRVREFLNACNYAMKNIHPADEQTVLEAIICTKFKGKAMIDFHTRDIVDYEQLKRELETEYLGKRSTAHLQLEFNSLRQKSNESAQEFGRRVDNIAMELYESMEEGQNHTSEQQRAILDNIKTQALHNYQIGLHDDIKLIVRAQRYKTLQEAITGASAEEKVKEPNMRKNAYHGQGKFDARTRHPQNLMCQKCGKMGHHGRDCRTSRYANRFSLPKPEGRPRVNTVDKYCNYCKKAGHVRNDCWSLKNRPEKGSGKNPEIKQKKSSHGNNKNICKKGNKKAIKNSESQSSDDDDSEEANAKKTRIAAEYRVAHFRRAPQNDTGLDLLSLPVQEAEKRVNFLFDTGATVSLLKLKMLKDNTRIYEEKIKLTGITGHSITTIGKTYATILLTNEIIKHPIYIVKDENSMEYDGILGADFIRKNKISCNYGTKEVRIGSTSFKLFPYRRITLKPRCETIVQVIANRNTIGITQAEETSPGIFIGSCLVEPQEFVCPVSILNTTESEAEIQVPQIIIEEVAIDAFPMNCIKAKAVSDPLVSREEKIKDLLRTNHLNSEEKKALINICTEFSDIFHLEGDPLTYTTEIEHEIITKTNSSSVNIRPYRLPEKHKIEVNHQIQEMLNQEIIRPSVSQWNAPLLVVPKKTDASGKPKLRVVIDFRKLNDLTIGDSFPIPNITDILDQLGNAKYFTTLDLASGYHQIPMAERDKYKTAFSTPYGHYEFNRMPFGLKNAPATFQRLMNSVLTGIQGLKCLVYLDDIVVYGPSLEVHNKRLITVLLRLRDSNLKLQPDKCEFLRKEVIYLGHIITENGISPDPSKLEAVKNFPIPKKVKDIQAFVGLAGYYRKFIEDFSKIAKPLTKLTKKGEKFEWTTLQQNAFETLKNKLTSAPVLKYPDFNQEFLVTTDASDYAIGAVLSQGEVGQDRPIAYASRVLSRTIARRAKL